VLKNILVALDDSDIADRVMESVLKLILPSDGKVILCHVFPTTNSEMEHPADHPYSESSTISYLQVEKQLQLYRDELPVDSCIELVSGDPAEEIICLANIYKANLIVIGSRGLTGMTRIVQGSVSSQVVEEANCSVWVVKPG
jgi:nucleotide-binding universal stress UspA family protein